MSKLEARFRILALSGGGFRGLYTARILEQLEEKTGGTPVARYFDLICGTSVGGIIALALALEIPAARIVALLKERGVKIFGGPAIQRKLRNPPLHRKHWVPYGISKARHSPGALRDALSAPDWFGDKIVGDCLHPVLVPAVNYSDAKAQLFKTPHHPDMEIDWKVPLVDVALATSAAPTYFPHHRIRDRVYVDGGLVANGPALFGLHEAEIRFGRDAKSEIEILAIGTLETEATASSAARLNKGIWQWRQDLFLLTSIVQERAMNQIVQHRLGHNFFLINETLVNQQVNDVALDLADEQAQSTLLGKANSSYQAALGRGLARFVDQPAASPIFYHGPQANR